jgi:hypothetical protein
MALAVSWGFAAGRASGGCTLRVREHQADRYYSPGLLHRVLFSAVCGLRGMGGCFEAGVVVMPAGAGLVAASPS